MNFDAVKSGALGVLGAAAIFRDNAGNLIKVEGPRHDVIAQRAHQAYVPLRRYGTRRNGQRAAEIIRVRDAPDVPEL